MSSVLAALVLATPWFGFVLQPPTVAPVVPDSILTPPTLADHDAEPEAAPTSSREAVDRPADVADEAPVDVSPTAERLSQPEGGADQPLTAEERTRLVMQREELSSIHRALGIATWASMLVTVTIGFFQFYNQYGFFASRESTPCTSGGAIFGQDQCWGIPWGHRISAITTTVLYGATFTLSTLLPDPNNLAEAQGDYPEKLRIHKALRWVHLGGMIAQLLLGFATGQNWFGTDRANDYDAQAALATVHMGIGLVTFGTLTASAALLLF